MSLYVGDSACPVCGENYVWSDKLDMLLCSCRSGGCQCPECKN